MNHWHLSAHQTGPWRHWLTDSGSLTQRLQSHCAAFSVRKVRQLHGVPYEDERNILRLPPHRLALLREVLLQCAGKPQVFAHTVVPLTGLNGPWRAISGMGNRPLGAALFADPEIERRPLEYRRLDQRHPLYRAAQGYLADPPRHLWARRSLFAKAGIPILVTEVFLPDVLALASERAHATPHPSIALPQ